MSLQIFQGSLVQSTHSQMVLADHLQDWVLACSFMIVVPEWKVVVAVFNELG